MISSTSGGYKGAYEGAVVGCHVSREWAGLGVQAGPVARGSRGVGQVVGRLRDEICPHADGLTVANVLHVAGSLHVVLLVCTCECLCLP